MTTEKPQRRGLSRIVYDHLILPFTESHAPVSHVSWGASIGMFVGLTPTMGIQMYIVSVIWVLCRYLLKFRFNLAIAVAIVWLSNPITVVPLYYAFLLTGDLILGVELGHLMDFREFSKLIEQMEANPDLGWAEGLIAALLLLFWQFGWPIAVGSLFWSVILAVGAYPVAVFAMLKYRNLMAARAGVTYAEWKQTNIHPD